MLISYAWLQSLCPVEVDAPRAAELLTARGLTVDSVEGSAGDEVFDVDIPANRPDCLGHLGVARELCAAMGTRPRIDDRADDEAGAGIADAFSVEVDEPSLCPRYTATLVRGVTVGQSPDWVRRRLEACDLRPVNNVVDVSNLVLLETGHPIHTFDRGRLDGGKIVVRRARAGETLRTLDGIDRELDIETLVIADAAQAMAVAGVIGGADSEIDDTTTEVLVEAAVFDPISVRRSARRLGIKTDASHRFERGVDPEGVVIAQRLASRWLHELAGGAAAPGMLDVRAPAGEPAELTLRPERVALLLGYAPSPDETRAALAALGLDPAEDEGRLRVTVPSWRLDLTREADLVEEVGRHLGYDRIPSHLPVQASAPYPERPIAAIEERVRDRLAQLGGHEAVSYAMIGAEDDEPFVFPDTPPPLRLTNPIAEPLAVLRRSLVPGLLQAADRNLRRGRRDVRLFEIGAVFHPTLERSFPDEHVRAGIVWGGARGAAHWSAPAEAVDFYDIAGLVEGMLATLAPGRPVHIAGLTLDGFHPGRSAVWSGSDGTRLAWAGELHPSLTRRMDLPAPLHLAEMELGELIDGAASESSTAPLAKVPAVTRDLAIVLPDTLAFDRVQATLRSVDAPCAAEFEVVDRYVGPPLVEGTSSLTLRVKLIPFEKSLTDEQTEAFRARLVETLQRELGVGLRSE